MIQSPKILLKTTKGYTFQPLNEILFFKSCDKYAEMHLLNQGVTMVFHSLSELEEKLCCGAKVGLYCYFRCHRQYIAALHFAAHWKESNGIEMENGTIIPVSRERVKPIRRFLHAIGD
ncbi:MAG: hypothetical protein EA392_03515 [Cryomorphaceae bacterium]|nr:MAG: hypothetical protein EA392_03515 [Cryomorphaceae bacterium]